VFCNARQIFSCQRSRLPRQPVEPNSRPRGSTDLPNYWLLVGPGGLEPPTSSLSGMRSSQLSYGPSNWWSWSGSNRRPPECKSGALPAELQPPKFGGRDQTARDREKACALSPAPGPRSLAPASTALLFNRGQLDTETRRPAPGYFRKTLMFSKWRPGTGSLPSPKR
jgi:hypothetical protein